MMVREVARYVPPGPDHFWRLDEALGELVARETGIRQPGRTYTLPGPARKSTTSTCGCVA
jgi:hypothetical protein